MASRNVAVLVALVSIVEFASCSAQQQSQQQQQQQQQQQPEQQQPRQQPYCTLGDDIFEVGERWNPNLPPFGVQVCVLCECTIRQRKSCYETKVTCRRITNECPVIDSCPDGKKPVTVSGQCCKSCQSAVSSELTTTAATTSTTTTTVTTTTTSSSSSSPTTNSANSFVSPTPFTPKLISTSFAPQIPTITQQTLSALATSTVVPSQIDNPSLNYRSSDLTIQPQQPQQQQWYGQLPPTLPTVTAFKLLYLNERTKEYLAIVKTYPACPVRDLPTTSSGSPINNQRSSGQQLPVGASTAAPSPVGGKLKDQSGKNDLNGIDTRLAFKSLHDSAYPSPSRGRASNLRPNLDSAQHPHDDQTRHDHQHPNDFQSTIAMTDYQISPSNVDQLPSMHNNRTAFNGPAQMCNNRPGVSNSSTSNCDTSYSATKGTPTHAHTDSKPQIIEHTDRSQIYASLSPNTTNPLSNQPLNTCKLGNDTFKIGDMWNPILPPFGVQVCVECNCVIKTRKNCYETRVTCRRTNKDCPRIESCPDGTLPITVAGQCCKTCQAETRSPAGEILQLENVVQRNEKVLREYQNVSKSMNLCAPKRDNNFAHVPPKSVAHSQSKRSQRTAHK